MMTCEYYERLISDRLDRALTDKEQAELQAHLDTCETCRAFSRQLGEFRAGLQSLPMSETDRPAPVPEAAEGFLSRIWHTRLDVPLPVAAGILLMLLSALLVSTLIGGGEGPTTEPAGPAQATYVQIEVISPSTAKPLETSTLKTGE